MPFPEILHHVLRWTARSLSALFLTFVLLNLLGSGLPNLGEIAPGDQLLWIGFALSLLGFAMLWKWELLGGILALSGIALFYVMHFMLADKFPAGWVFPLFFLPGCLSILSWLMNTQRRNRLVSN